MRAGNVTWINHGDGEWHDLGDLQGDDLAALLVALRMPLMRVSVAWLPGPVRAGAVTDRKGRGQALRAFQFDHRPRVNAWHAQSDQFRAY